jgi:hypothetical protein
MQCLSRRYEVETLVIWPIRRIRELLEWAGGAQHDARKNLLHKVRLGT